MEEKGFALLNLDESNIYLSIYIEYKITPENEKKVKEVCEKINNQVGCNALTKYQSIAGDVDVSCSHEFTPNSVEDCCSVMDDLVRAKTLFYEEINKAAD